MQVKVKRVWSYGRRQPKKEWPGLCDHIGELRMIESQGEVLNRTMRSAHLMGNVPQKYNEIAYTDVIPALIDAAVLRIRGNKMIITGYEVEFDRTTYAQTWLVEIVGGKNESDT